MGGVDLDCSLVKGRALGGKTVVGCAESLDRGHELEGAA